MSGITIRCPCSVGASFKRRQTPGVSHGKTSTWEFDGNGDDNDRHVTMTMHTVVQHTLAVRIGTMI